MFRKLATRLTAAYVFAAIVLVVIVVTAVTAFALSVFGISARAESAALAREVPEEVRFGILRMGTLDVAAGDIVRRLSRPGLHVVLFGVVGDHQRFLAATTGPDDAEGRPTVVTYSRARTFPGSDAQPPPIVREADRMRHYPLGLNVLLRIAPRTVEFEGGRLTIFPDPTPLARTIDAFWLAMLPIGLFVVFAAWFLGRYITGQALRPLVETTASLNRFGMGDFTPRAIVTTDRSEIGLLVKAYNAAVAQVSHAFEERAVAEAHMRQFIADAGHELRTPLTVIMGFIDVLRRRALLETGVSTKIFDTMLAESRRMKTLIDKLIVLARLENAQARELETVDLGEVALAVVTALQSLTVEPRISLASEAGCLVRGYENELHDAISNLVENALKYAPDSPVDVRVRRDGAAVVVDVVDCGPGIGSGDRAHVFDRFYRGSERADTEGFGLGLAIAQRAVERAGGGIALVSEPGAGSRFTICIPGATLAEGAALADEQRPHADSYAR